MTDQILLDNIEHANQIGAAAQVHYNPATDHCLSRVKNRRLLGGVIFQGFTGASIELHMAGFDPHWICKDLIWATFAYPFLQLGCLKVIGRVAETNTRALELDLKLGFIEEARIRDAYVDGDLIILTMRRADCRWLKIAPRSRFWEQPNGEK